MKSGTGTHVEWTAGWCYLASGELHEEPVAGSHVAGQGGLDVDAVVPEKKRGLWLTVSVFFLQDSRATVLYVPHVASRHRHVDAQSHRRRLAGPEGDLRTMMIVGECVCAARRSDHARRPNRKEGRRSYSPLLGREREEGGRDLGHGGAAGAVEAGPGEVNAHGRLRRNGAEQCGHQQKYPKGSHHPVRDRDCQND